MWKVMFSFCLSVHGEGGTRLGKGYAIPALATLASASPSPNPSPNPQLDCCTQGMLRRGRYASCSHAGGLSCFDLYCRRECLYLWGCLSYCYGGSEFIWIEEQITEFPLVTQEEFGDISHVAVIDLEHF